MQKLCIWDCAGLVDAPTLPSEDNDEPGPVLSGQSQPGSLQRLIDQLAPADPINQEQLVMELLRSSSGIGLPAEGPTISSLDFPADSHDPDYSSSDESSHEERPVSGGTKGDATQDKSPWNGDFPSASCNRDLTATIYSSEHATAPSESDSIGKADSNDCVRDSPAQEASMLNASVDNTQVAADQASTSATSMEPSQDIELEFDGSFSSIANFIVTSIPMTAIF